MDNKLKTAAQKLKIPWLEDLEPARSYTHYAMRPEYVTIHNAGSPWGGKSLHAYNRRSIATSCDGIKSWHLSCGEDGVYQALPFDTNGWHAGDGGGPGNLKSIGIEIARDLCQDTALYSKAENMGAKAAACVLYSLGLGVDLLRKHQDWSGKYCPHRILREGRWESFKSEVGLYLKDIKGASSDHQAQITEPTPPDQQKTFYRVQVGAFSEYANADRYRKSINKMLGAECLVVKAIVNNKQIYRVQLGAFTAFENAKKYEFDLQSRGIVAFVIPVNIPAYKSNVEDKYKDTIKEAEK